jgi:tetratricopeptide (TPR) repeat protein
MDVNDNLRAAELAFAESRYERALELYDEILAVEPRQPRALYRRGVSLQLLGRHAEALSALQRARQAGAAPAVWLRIAESALALGDEPAAAEALRSAGNDGFDDVAALDSAELGALRDQAAYGQLREQVARNREPCAHDPRYHALDFWIGTWLARAPDGREIGTNHIFPILGGCVLSENWTNVAGLSGKSYSFFDKERDTWRQTWIDDHGVVAEFSHGHASDGAVTFFTDGRPDGSGVRRLTFTRIDDAHLRQLSEVSDAGGAWTVEYDLAYERLDGGAGG